MNYLSLNALSCERFCSHLLKTVSTDGLLHSHEVFRKNLPRAYLRGLWGPCPLPMSQWPQILVTMDASKMHQNVAFPGIIFCTTPQSFFRSFRSLIVICLIKMLIVTVLPVFWLLSYNVRFLQI